ncbi:MAG: hypothetical protein EWM73_01908 [Nitrospira sp.]|nr:MAG: hypothetical protein EWM73_01908 [Nitrospira sp.]
MASHRRRSEALRVEVYRDGLLAELIVNGGMDLLDLREDIGFRYAVE